MCKCNKNRRNCKQNPCGCEKIDAKCVLYNGECLSTLNICSDTDLEQIIKVIDDLIQDILEQIEETWVAANVGGGAEIYKGISSLGIHVFRTAIDSVSIKVTENENNISFAVDEEWLEGVITKLIDEAISEIPDTELNSPLNSISITSTGTNEFDLDLNPSTFTSLNDSITITSSTVGGELKIDLQINTRYLDDLLPKIVNVGTGAEIYKGLNLAENKHEFRGIDVEVTQPSTTDNQITGTVGASADVVGDDVQIKLDFSNLRVPIQQVGIPEYYVHSAGNDSTADGSIVRPYKTWDACKAAIIDAPNGGTFYNPQKNGVRVIFLTNITSEEDLTVRNVTYVFQNNAVFTYEGSTQGVIDMEKIVNSPTTSASINIQGTGEIRAYSPDPNTSAIVVRAAANDTAGHWYRISFLGNSYITLREMYSADLVGNQIELTDDGNGSPTINGAGGPVYVVAKTGHIDRITVNEGVLSVKGRNTPVAEAVTIENSATVRIAAGVNRAIYIQGGVIAGYGSIVLTSVSLQGGLSNNSLVRYGGNPSGSGQGRYKPSTTVSHILIDGGSSTKNSSLLLYGNGALSGLQLGGTHQGGYDSIVEIRGQASLSIRSSFTWTNHTRYNYLFYIADAVCPLCPNNRRTINLNNVYTRVYPEKFIVGGIKGVDDTNTQIYIGNGGDVEASGLLTSQTDKIYDPIIEKDLTITSPFMLLTEKPYSNFGITPHSNNQGALDWGLKPGMFYRTTDPTESILKIVH